MKFLKLMSLVGVFCLSFTSIAAFADDTPVWVKINITNNTYFFWDFQNSTITNSTFEGSNIPLKPQGTTTVNIYPVFISGENRPDHIDLTGNLNYTFENSTYGCSINIVCRGWNDLSDTAPGCYDRPLSASVTPISPGNLYQITCNLATPKWDPGTGLFTLNLTVNAKQ